MQVNNRPQISFQGIIAFSESTNKAKMLSKRLLSSSQQILDANTGQVYIYFKDGCQTAEDYLASALKKAKIPYIHCQKPKLTIDDFHEFAKFTALG